MSGKFRGIADERRVGHFADLDNVIGDEPVAAADQFKRDFGFTDAAVAHDEDADAVDIDKYAVDGHALRELDLEPAGEFRRQTGGRLV